jgi:hypothetical protein
MASDGRARTGGVRLWWARLDPPPRVEVLADLLSPRRVDPRRHVPVRAGRRRFVVAHGMLREAIAACTGMAAGEVTFGRGPGGKPTLTGPPPQPVHFSLSHSDERCLIGVSLREGARSRPDPPACSCRTGEKNRRAMDAPGAYDGRDMPPPPGGASSPGRRRPVRYGRRRPAPRTAGLGSGPATQDADGRGPPGASERGPW